MSEKLKLKVDLRKITGRKVKKLRRDNLIPANISGRKIKSLAIQVGKKDFKAAFAKVGETGILELTIAKETKTRPVLIHFVQVHPVTEEILHVDFRQVDLTEKVSVAVPVEVIGVSPAIAKGGVLIQLIKEIEVEALPNDLPEKFILDTSKLTEIGQGITLKDVKVDASKVKIMSENLDELVLKIEEPTKEEVVEAPVAEAAPTEGEADPAAEGDKKEEDKKPEVKKEESKAEKK